MKEKGQHLSTDQGLGLLTGPTSRKKDADMPPLSCPRTITKDWECRRDQKDGSRMPRKANQNKDDQE